MLPVSPDFIESVERAAFAGEDVFGALGSVPVEGEMTL